MTIRAYCGLLIEAVAMALMVSCTFFLLVGVAWPN
jgi:hypothetical protein